MSVDPKALGKVAERPGAAARAKRQLRHGRPLLHFHLRDSSEQRVDDVRLAPSGRFDGDGLNVSKASYDEGDHSGDVQVQLMDVNRECFNGLVLPRRVG